jgi:hypothetical protein
MEAGLTCMKALWHNSWQAAVAPDNKAIVYTAPGNPLALSAWTGYYGFDLVICFLNTVPEVTGKFREHLAAWVRLLARSAVPTEKSRASRD